MLSVGQSALTGESDAVRKLATTDLTSNEISSISDLDTICFMGTNVISGSAKCVVIKTANNTYFGKIAKTLSSNKQKSSFQKGIEGISKLLIKFITFREACPSSIQPFSCKNISTFFYFLLI